MKIVQAIQKIQKTKLTAGIAFALAAAGIAIPAVAAKPTTVRPSKVTWPGCGKGGDAHNAIVDRLLPGIGPEGSMLVVFQSAPPLLIHFGLYVDAARARGWYRGDHVSVIEPGNGCPGRIWTVVTFTGEAEAMVATGMDFDKLAGKK